MSAILPNGNVADGTGSGTGSARLHRLRPPSLDTLPGPSNGLTILPVNVAKASSASVPSQSRDSHREQDKRHENGATSSGHSIIRKGRFAGSLTGPLLASYALGYAREVYTLELGVNPRALGAALLVCNFTYPLSYPLAGYIMDKVQLCSRCFDRKAWGRRSIWFGTHLVALSVCAGTVYIPPSEDSDFLVAWLVMVQVIGSWAAAVIYTSFESARPEIYPMQDERVMVESLTKILCGVGVGIATVAVLLILGDSSFQARFIASMVMLSGTLLSLQAVPVLADANRECDMTAVGPPWSEWAEVLRQPAMLCLVGLRFWQGALETLIVTFALYHLTVVCGVTGTDRRDWLFLVGLLLVTVELVLLPLFTFTFRNGCLDMRLTCASAHGTFGVLLPLMLKFLPIKEQYRLIVYCAGQRIAFAPQTWFRANAFCWIVDEDCLANSDKRREGTFAGVTNFIGNLGRTFASGFLYLGLTEAGLQTRNCNLACDGLDDGCTNSCERQLFDSQPKSVRQYIEALFFFVAPAFQLLCAIHIFCFPIKGERLEQLCRQQEGKIGPLNGSFITPDGTVTVLGKEVSSPSCVEPAKVIVSI